MLVHRTKINQFTVATLNFLSFKTKVCLNNKTGYDGLVNCFIYGHEGEKIKASDLLKEYDVSKSLLNNLDGIKIRVVVRSDSLIVFLVIGAMNKERSIPITTNNLESPIMQIIN